MANSSDDALVGLGNLCKSYAGNREVLLRDRDTGVVTATMWVDLDDLRALLTAYATVQAERDAANEGLASIRKLDLSGESGKGWKANVAMQGAALEMFTASMADVFKDKGGPNYVEASLRDVRDGTVYFCIVGPKRGKTPHELRQAAESEIATLRETLVGELEAERNPHGPSNCTLCEINLVCHEQWMATAHNAALDRAITIIKGTP